MRSKFRRVVHSLAVGLVCGLAMPVSLAANAPQDAMTATIVGEMIQKVGFRAMIQKQAIMYNLAGYTRNNSDGTVTVYLQGDKDGIDKTLEAIISGNKKSSKANIVADSTSKFDHDLKTFTIIGWTSKSRNITHPYDLIFDLRPTENKISKAEAKSIWNAIAEKTLKGDDLAKFMKHLDDDD